MTVLGNTRRPDVTFYTNGRIDITARAARLLNLHDGDVIDIASIDGECYLYVKHLGSDVTGRHQAAVHATKRGSRNYRCHSIKLAAFVLSRHEGMARARLPLGEPTVLPHIGFAVPIIIRNNIKDS